LNRTHSKTFWLTHEKGSLVKGTIKEVDAKGAVVTLADNVEGYLRASEIQRDRVEDARTLLKEGDQLEAKFIGVDKKSKSISLSIKAKDQDEETHSIKDHSQQSVGSPTFADIFKQMEK